MKKLSELFNLCAYKIHYEQAGDSVNYAFLEENSTLYIFFEGSNSISDWVRNFLFGKKPYKDMKIKYRVHRGFLAAWKEVENIIKEKIKNKKYQEIIVVGYSHGAALAGLCHECCWFNRPDIREHIYGYGFEAPRFFAHFKVKKALKERWTNFTVVRTNCDIVTHCPPRIFGYTHVGHLLKIKGNISLVQERLPRCIKSHYPQVVYNALLRYEKDL